MRLEYHARQTWPSLSWLARCHTRDPRVTIDHGPKVQTSDEFFCEAVWAGKYDDGALDETDIIVGSGGRLANGGLTFVSSGSTVDRLHVLRDETGVWVSNSLVCLLGAAGGTCDPCYAGYYRDFYSVVKGLERYMRHLATSLGAVELIYFDNLRWDGRALTRQPKPGGTRDFSTFDHYRRFLETSVDAFAENASARHRHVPYRMLATISTGYDSPTVAALARDAGCDEAICFDRSHKGEDDSGETIARYLGLRAVRIDGTAWRSFDFPEVPFIASDSMGEEVRFRGAEPYLVDRVLLTGFHGDKMWDPATKALGADLVRGDPSGLALTEYRLWAGFLHCPLPFWGARQIRDVNRLSRTPELRPWDVGGDYNRPICRRIVEELGVPRELFGVAKKNASVMLHNYGDFLTPASMRDFLQWLKTHRGDWLTRGRLPPLASPRLDRVVHALTDAFSEWGKDKRVVWRLVGRLEGPTYMRRFLFPWAVERAKQRYGPT